MHWFDELRSRIKAALERGDRVVLHTCDRRASLEVLEARDFRSVTPATTGVVEGTIYLPGQYPFGPTDTVDAGATGQAPQPPVVANILLEGWIYLAGTCSFGYTDIVDATAEG
jgi:hypothetical protein